MRIFVTGGTGYVGTAVVPALVQAGHKVTGLVRTTEKATQLKALGGTPVMGNIREPITYGAIAAEHEGIIHMAFDAAGGLAEADRIAVDTLLDAAKQGGARHFIYTSGCLVVGPAGAEPATEDAPTDNPIGLVAWRPANEQRALHAASERLATAALRPAWVFGGKNGFPSRYFASAEKDGAAVYVGSGENHMPLVHLDDVARLYGLIVEKRARGVYHAVDDSHLRVREIAAAASHAAGRGGAVQSMPIEAARQTMGAFADALCADQWVAAPRSKALGWRPEHPHFAAAAATLYAAWKG